MLTLGTPRIPIHQLLHQIRAYYTRIAGDLLRDLQRLGQHALGRINGVREQSIPDGIASQISGACGDGLHGARETDESGKEEGRAGFHDETAAGEDEPDFCVLVRDADVHGERHGDADSDGGTLEGANGGFAAVVDC